jgi:hypothetical protein
MALKEAEAIKGTVPPVTQYKYLNLTYHKIFKNLLRANKILTLVYL